MSDVKPRRRETYAEMTRAAILEAAENLFATAGFDKTSVDDIARDCQVSKGAIYHHFRDKREVFAAVYRRTLNELLGIVSAAVAEPDIKGWQQVEVAVSASLSYYATRTHARSLVRQAISALGEERTMELDAEVAIPLITALLTEMDKLGELRPVDLPTAAELIFRLLSEAAMTIADSDQSKKVETVAFAMIGGLRVDPSRK